MRTVLTWLGIGVTAILVLWLLLHIVISPVNPAQKPPEGHPSQACWACHFVTESAEVREP